MKIRDIKPKKHRLFIQWIATYILLVIILAGTTVPIYLQSYASVKNSVISDTEASVEYGVELLQKEISTYYAILDSLKSQREYKLLMDLSEPSDNSHYIYMAELQKYFRDMLLSSVIQENTFLMFSKNDIVFSKYSVFNDMEDFYGKIWNIEGLSYADMRQRFFGESHHGGFLPFMQFRDIEKDHVYDLVFAFTVSGSRRNENAAVLFSVYDTEKILSLLGLDRIAKSGRIRMINGRGEENICLDNLKNSDKKADLTYSAPNADFVLEITIADSFYAERLSSTRRMLVLYFVLFIVLGLGLSLAFAYRNERPMKKLIKSLSADEAYPDENEYEYIQNYIMGLSSSQEQFRENMLDNMLLKLLFTGLEKTEKEELHRIWGGVFDYGSLVLIKSTVINWDERLEFLLETATETNYKSFLLDPYTKVIFFGGNSMNETQMKSIIFDLNIEDYSCLKCVMSKPYNIFSDTVEVFKRLRGLIRYVDECMFLSIDAVKSDDLEVNFVKKNYEESKPLREYLLSGNAFEANKIVYSQWYRLSQNPRASHDITNQFYYQTGILSQLMIDTGFEEPPPECDDEKDLLANATDITQYINRFCEYINGRKEDTNHRDVEIMSYIKEHYSDSSFYLTSLSDKFGLSTKTVTQIVKKMTGMTFSVYLNRLRLGDVERLLRETDNPIQEITVQCGFESMNSLLKSFKKEYGVSPTVYRKNNRES